MDSKLKSFAVDLYNINGIKFGEFKTKVGLMTPVYCDLRVIVSHPIVMVRIKYLSCNGNNIRSSKTQNVGTLKQFINVPLLSYYLLMKIGCCLLSKRSRYFSSR